MASPGLLFLLMVSSSLLLSGLSAPSSSKQLQTHARHKPRADEKKVVVTAAKYSAKILSAVAPFMSIIPVHGTLIRAILSLVSAVLGGLGPDATQDLIKREFENLNIKIDQYHKEQKWDTWASKYADYETKIDTKWDNFKDLVKVFEKKGNEKEWNKTADEFKNQYQPDDISEFANLLTKDNALFITNFGKLISEHVYCHEKDVKVLTQVINTLIYQGVTMSHFVYKLKGLNKVDKLADTAYKVSSAMFQIHKKCIINSMKFVEEDVKKRCNISPKQNFQKAKNIRAFLEKAYDRYDWTVVVFEKNKIVKRHDLTGFNEVERGELIVAVSRQLKGKHTKANKVSDDIKKCVKDSDLCKDLVKKLTECELASYYSAVHIYIHKSHDSKIAKDSKEAYEEMSPEDSSAQTPYVYKGKCFGGKFQVFIKSDEEIEIAIEKKDPCSTMKCGDETKGECVLLDTLIPMCECKKPYYGENCEDNLDDYKKKMNAEMPKSQSTKIQVKDSRRSVRYMNL